MNIVHSGTRFQVYGQELETSKLLPPQTYDLNFEKMSGFFLSKRPDLSVTEEKVYGSSPEKLEKVMRSYALTNRNFGVLLSGQKGIGKSLFIRMLASHAISKGLPVIVVSFSIPGIASFLSSIEQDCVVIFDEFEKTFMDKEDDHPQDELLTLFDGIDGGHKLFIVSCNDTSKVSQFMLNRPGRFHYHFTMSPPSPDEVRRYMEDKVLPLYQAEIPEVVNLSSIIDMPYDFLRAIAFELNQGYSIKEAMSDLNIARAENMRYDITVTLSDGMVFGAADYSVDITDKRSTYITLMRFRERQDFLPTKLPIRFIPSSIVIENNEMVIKEAEFDYDEPFNPSDFDTDEETGKKLADHMNGVSIRKMVLKKSMPALGKFM